MSDPPRLNPHPDPRRPGWADETETPPVVTATRPGPGTPDLQPGFGPVLLPPEPEAEGALRHQPAAPVPLPETGAMPGSVGAIATALGTLLAGGVVLGSASLVMGFFERSPWLGWPALAVALASGGLAAGAAIAEWRALHRLGRVESLSERLRALPDSAPVPATLAAWFDSLAPRLPGAGAALAELRRAPDIGTARGLWRSTLAPQLDAAVAELGRRSARQVFWGTAIAPSPALDGAVVAVLGLRLVRQVATLHGMRPGALALGRLLRRVLSTITLTAGMDLAAEAALHQTLEARAASMAGGAAGAVVAALRMPRLAAATALACRPF
jgi:putative membrane protein